MTPVLRSHVDPRSDVFGANRAALLEALAQIDGLLAQVTAGGGTADAAKNARTVARHRGRQGSSSGADQPARRSRLGLPRGSPRWPAGVRTTPWARSAVTGIGRINGIECVVSANDPTVKGGSQAPITVTKALRAMSVAHDNRLPLVSLTESGG